MLFRSLLFLVPCCLSSVPCSLFFFLCPFYLSSFPCFCLIFLFFANCLLFLSFFQFSLFSLRLFYCPLSFVPFQSILDLATSSCPSVHLFLPVLCSLCPHFSVPCPFIYLSPVSSSQFPLHHVLCSVFFASCSCSLFSFPWALVPLQIGRAHV